MKIIAFNGSPKGERSKTHKMVMEFLKGATDAGAKTEEIFLIDNKIGNCRGCFSCWIKTPGKCVVDDDMTVLIEKFVNADIAVIATPLYVDNVTGITKNFLDRLIPILDEHITVDTNGESLHALRYGKSPKLVVISNSGFPEQSQFQVLKILFRRVARNMHSEIIGEIYRGGGGILSDSSSEVKHKVQDYLGLLYESGVEVVRDGRISENTMNTLEKPLFTAQDYRNEINNMFDNASQKYKNKRG